MFKPSCLLLPLALALTAAALHAATPGADPAFFRLLDVLHGEADEASAIPPGEGAKPARLTGAAAKAGPLFTQATARRQAGDAVGAREILHQLLALPRLDSRRALRAWKGLRDLGETPDGPAAGQVLGVVVEFDYEVEGEHAILTVASYPDGDPVLAASSGYSLLGARLLARTVVTGRSLVTAAQPLLAEIPAGEDRKLPGNGQIRFTLLTPGGPHTRELARRELESDPATSQHPLRPLYIAAQQLLAALRLESERLEDARRP